MIRCNDGMRYAHFSLLVRGLGAIPGVTVALVASDYARYAEICDTWPSKIPVACSDSWFLHDAECWILHWNRAVF